MKNTIIVVLILGLSIQSLGQNQITAKKAIKEAENMTILQDRLTACATLSKAYRKLQGAEAKLVREKLFYFSNYFYTDKGFQKFHTGKELFEKAKYNEAIENLADADTLEKGNTDILHLLTQSYLFLKKNKQAEESSLKAVQINPVNIELQKDRLSSLKANESWKELLELSEELMKSNAENTNLLLTFKGVALIKLQRVVEAQTLLEGLIQKDAQYPEPYFWLAEINQGKVAENYLLKYKDLCKNKKTSKTTDLELCANISAK